MHELFEEKLKVVLNLIRTNNSAEDALKYTQAVSNLVRAQSDFVVLSPKPKQEPEEKPKKTGT